MICFDEKSFENRIILRINFQYFILWEDGISVCYLYVLNTARHRAVLLTSIIDLFLISARNKTSPINGPFVKPSAIFMIANSDRSPLRHHNIDPWPCCPQWLKKSVLIIIQKKQNEIDKSMSPSLSARQNLGFMLYKVVYVDLTDHAILSFYL